MMIEILMKFLRPIMVKENVIKVMFQFFLLGNIFSFNLLWYQSTLAHAQNQYIVAEPNTPP